VQAGDGSVPSTGDAGMGAPGSRAGACSPGVRAPFAGRYSGGGVLLAPRRAARTEASIRLRGTKAGRQHADSRTDPCCGVSVQLSHPRQGLEGDGSGERAQSASAAHADLGLPRADAIDGRDDAEPTTLPSALHGTARESGSAVVAWGRARTRSGARGPVARARAVTGRRSRAATRQGGPGSAGCHASPGESRMPRPIPRLWPGTT